MSYIGNVPAESFLTLERQVFTTSATDTYTLDRSVSSPNDIELFLNNVRQQPVEAYNISGTTLTLASAITASDSMYCIYQGRAVGTVTPTLPITNFSSTGIDDNASSTAITIDTSQNVLVGKTSNNRTDVGSEIRPIGFIRGTRLDGHPFDAVRTNSDGDIMRFYRDAGQVGQITAYTTGISINLGGTGTANALDDYEEGTWTPTIDMELSSPSVTYSHQYGYYTKIGRMVYVTFNINISSASGGSGATSVSSLPFTSSSATNQRWAGSTSYNSIFSNSGKEITPIVNQSKSVIYFNYSNNNTNLVKTAQISSTPSSGFIQGAIYYMTD